MNVILWDTRKLDVSKDFAGGFGVGQYPPGGGFRDRLIRWFYTRDRRPVALLWAHLAAIFPRLGHRVEYVEDRLPPPADLYVFYPSLITLDLERRVIAGCWPRGPAARVLVVGTAASVLPEAFAGLGVTVVKGEAEQLLWKLDEVLAERPGAMRAVGHCRRPRPAAAARLVAVLRRGGSASATTSGGFPRRWCRPAAAAR